MLDLHGYDMFTDLSSRATYQFLDMEAEGRFDPFDEADAANESCNTSTIVSRADSDRPPFRLICCIEGLPRNQAPAILGSGTLIAPNIVLTAAHVLVDPRRGIVVPPARVRVSPGRGGRAGTEQSLATRIFPNPAWVRLRQRELRLRRAGRAVPPNLEVQLAERDFGIVELARPLGTRFGYWGETPRRADDTRGTQIGALEGWRAGRFCINHSGFPRFNACVQTHHWSRTISSSNPRFLFVDGSVQQGESGGPAWVTRDRSLGGRHLFGIVTHGIGVHPDLLSSRAMVRLLNDSMILRFVNSHLR